MKKNILTYLITFITGFVTAQDQNIFLDRDFWKSSPSITEVDQKIKEGNNPSEINTHGFDAVVYAILEKAPNNTIKHLLSFTGNEVNKLTHDKRTYVFWAAYKNNLPLMKFLISKGAKMDVIDAHGYSVLTFAAITGNSNKKIYELCIEQGIDIADTNENGANSLLLVLSQLEDLSFIDYLISKGLTLKATDNDGNGAFNYAAKGGNKKTLQFLINKKLPYKGLNKNNGNAMLLATRGTRKSNNSLSFFKFLDSLGIASNISNKKGNTPLLNISYRNKHKETFDFFFEKGADANHTDKEGNTALIIASIKNSLEINSLLLEKTKDINHQNKEGISALSYAVQYNTPDIVEHLIKNNADIHLKDKKGNPISYYLIKGYRPKKHDAFIKKLTILTTNGYNIRQNMANGNSILHEAIDKDNLSLLKTLEGYNLDVNSKNKNGYTALQKAVMQAKDTEIIKYLLHIGANKHIKTSFGETLYDLAKENEILNSKKADVNFLKQTLRP